MDESNRQELLAPGDVAKILNCSYGEARRRMLDGRIRAVKDGRWCRSRREWINQYLEEIVVRPVVKADGVAAPLPPKRAAKVKFGSIADQFLRERKA